MNDELPDERPQRRREYSGPASTLGLAALVIVTVGAAIWWLEVRDGGSGAARDPGMGIVALPGHLNPTGEPPAAREGRAAPDFQLHTLDGTVARLSDYRGQFVLINFWASWCGPCRGETPDLEAFYRQYRDRGLVVLGVNQQEPEGTARSFAELFDVTYPVLLDRTGGVSDGYRVSTGLPISFFVDREGVIRRIFIGRVAWDDLEALAREYIET
ncbi:MAG: hypothetical protein Kow0010_15230 [Dehalococcoidia bacterium]